MHLSSLFILYAVAISPSVVGIPVPAKDTWDLADEGDFLPPNKPLKRPPGGGGYRDPYDVLAAPYKPPAAELHRLPVERAKKLTQVNSAKH